MALGWRDVDLAKRPLTRRLTAALQQCRHLRSARMVCDGQCKALTQKVVQVTMRRVARRAKVIPGVHVVVLAETGRRPGSRAYLVAIVE